MRADSNNVHDDGKSRVAEARRAPVPDLVVEHDGHATRARSEVREREEVVADSAWTTVDNDERAPGGCCGSKVTMDAIPGLDGIIEARDSPFEFAFRDTCREGHDDSRKGVVIFDTGKSTLVVKYSAFKQVTHETAPYDIGGLSV